MNKWMICFFLVLTGCSGNEDVPEPQETTEEITISPEEKEMIEQITKTAVEDAVKEVMAEVTPSAIEIVVEEAKERIATASVEPTVDEATGETVTVDVEAMVHKIANRVVPSMVSDAVEKKTGGLDGLAESAVNEAANRVVPPLARTAVEEETEGLVASAESDFREKIGELTASAESGVGERVGAMTGGLDGLAESAVNEVANRVVPALAQTAVQEVAERIARISAVIAVNKMMAEPPGEIEEIDEEELSGYTITLQFTPPVGVTPSISVVKHRDYILQREGDCVRLQDSQFDRLDILITDTRDSLVFGALCSFRLQEAGVCEPGHYNIKKSKDGQTYSLEPAEIVNDSHCAEFKELRVSSS